MTLEARDLHGTWQLDDRDASEINTCTPGIAQEVIGSNLGYGQLYYALTRLLRPRTVLVVGSGYGFTPGVIALALKHDGGRGRVLFVDPGYSNTVQGPERAHGGAGTWSTDRGMSRFDCLGVRALIKHYRERNDQFFPRYGSRGLPRPDLIVIDGAHDLRNAQYDAVNAIRLVKKPGYVLMHDSTNWWTRTGHMGVADVVRGLALEHEVLTFPGRAGLSLIRVVRQGRRLDLAVIPPAPVLGLGAMILGAAFAVGVVVGRRSGTEA